MDFNSGSLKRFQVQSSEMDWVMNEQMLKLVIWKEKTGQQQRLSWHRIACFAAVESASIGITHWHLELYAKWTTESKV